MPFFDQSRRHRSSKKYKNLVVVKTFSKGYSLAGMRCGYAVADRVAHLRGWSACRDCFNSYPVDSVCQAVCAAAIADGAYYKEKNALVISERERLSEALASARDSSFLPSAANFVFAAPSPLFGAEACTKNCARAACWSGTSKRNASVNSAASRSARKRRTTRFCRRLTGS